MLGEKLLPVGEKMDIDDPVGEVGDDITKTSGKMLGLGASHLNRSRLLFLYCEVVNFRCPG